MNLLAFLFEISDKIPSVWQMYFSGVIFAIVVLLLTHLNRMAGLIVLFICILFSTISISDSLGADILEYVRSEMGENYFTHWRISIYFSVILETFAFISALLLKRMYRNGKLNLK